MLVSDPSPPLPAAAGACPCLSLEENAPWAWWNWEVLAARSDTHCGASCPPGHVGKRPALRGCSSGPVRRAECCVSIKTTTTTPTILTQFRAAHFQLLGNHKESSMWTVPLSQHRPPSPEYRRVENKDTELDRKQQHRQWHGTRKSTVPSTPWKSDVARLLHPRGTTQRNFPHFFPRPLPSTQQILLEGRKQRADTTHSLAVMAVGTQSCSPTTSAPAPSAYLHHPTATAFAT